MRKFLVSHPTGNNFVSALLEELLKQNKLALFFTMLGFGKGSIPYLLKFKRRMYDIPNRYIRHYPLTEIIRLANRFPVTYLQKRKKIDQIYSNLDLKVSKNLKELKISTIHSYEDCAYNSFKIAKEMGISCSYELPISYWQVTRKLLAEEAERLPKWRNTLENYEEHEEKLVRKEEELKLADYITCPSGFVLKSIPKKIQNSTPCQVVPFGSPSILCDPYLEKSKNKNFKVLFVGSMTQRKGLADIFEAMKILKNEPIDLSILGQNAMPMDFYRNEYSDFIYYPTRSNKEVQKVMHLHDILVLPSIVEGRALVQQEALACGLPIIITPNTGGEDLVDDGITGSIVPIRNPTKIAEQIFSFYEQKISHEMRQMCIRKAAKYRWSNYAKKILEFSCEV